MKLFKIFGGLIILFCLSFNIEKNELLTDDHSETIDLNLKALSGVHEINGELYVIDSIPCFSAAQIKKSFFRRIRDEHYVDCSTCKTMPGRPRGPLSKCISIRKYYDD